MYIHCKQLFFLTIIFVVLDIIVLNALSLFFKKQILSVQGMPLQMNLLAALLCYISLILLLYIFIIVPNKSVGQAFLLGILVYAVYEFTNKTLFIRWNWTTTFVDTLWGGCLFALTTFFFHKVITIKR
jgi:uncharacterized membrane protein